FRNLVLGMSASRSRHAASVMAIRRRKREYSQVFNTQGFLATKSQASSTQKARMSLIGKWDNGWVLVGSLVIAATANPVGVEISLLVSTHKWLVFHSTAAMPNIWLHQQT